MLALFNKIRLSYFFVILFGFFSLLAWWIPPQPLDSALLTLFSVNSFLYGFYTSPIISSQRTRIDDLHRAVRSEANALFSLALKFKKLSPELHAEIQGRLTKYLKAAYKEKGIEKGEDEYEDLITFLVEYKGKEESIVDEILKDLASNQSNRTNVNMLARNKVYKNEWIIMFLLFTITVSFILMLNVQGSLFFQVMVPVLCTGLTMLLIILAKMSTLTHKRAKEIWTPYKTLVNSHYYKISD